MGTLNLLIIIAILLIILEFVIQIHKKYKEDTQNETHISIVKVFIDCVPVIDETISDFIALYKASSNEDDAAELTATYLYDIINKNVHFDERLASIINKENVMKYLVPVFKKVYEKELKKK